jgi:hypothetical protein
MRQALFILTAGLLSFGSYCGLSSAKAAMITGLGGVNNIASTASRTSTPAPASPGTHPLSNAVNLQISNKTAYTDTAGATFFDAASATITLTWGSAVNLSQLGAYISSNVPGGVDTFLDRETASVQFQIDTGSGFNSVGTVADTSFILAPEDTTNIWSFASIAGNWTNVVGARYIFTRVGEVNGPRVGEITAIQSVPEPGSLTLLVAAAMGFGNVVRRRRSAAH